MKKICFVVSSPLVANAFLNSHISVLQTEFDVYIIVNLNEKLADLSLPQLDKYHVQHVQIERNISIKSDIKALLKLRHYFKTMKFDVVHSITPKAGLLAMIAAKFSGVKNRVHIFTGQVWFTKEGLMKLLLICFDKIIVKFATHILVDGESQRKFLIDKHIIKAANSTVFGKGSISGVDVLKFNPTVDTRYKIRKELMILDHEVVFVFLGRINKDKGILDLAKAFKMLSDEYSNAKLLVIGYDEGNLISEINNIIGVTKSVIFYGPTSQPENILQAADVVCLPSYREGFGTSVIEASILGICIICSDTYGLMDTIVENETGLRHPVGDIELLHKQMRKLMESSDLREHLGNNGRKYVLKNFSANNMSRLWLKFYMENFKV